MCQNSPIIFAKNTNSLLPENLIGQPFYELSEVDSANNYAMGQVQTEMAEHGAVWFTHYQSAGKGQRGKSWMAEPGQNLLMSVALEPSFLSVDNQFLLNVIIALSCCKFFQKYAVDSSCIKWPNDIYWKDRKAGGILIENVFRAKRWKYSIVGIGININQTLFSPDLPNPVSLKQITGTTFEPVALAKELCELLQYNWNELKHGKGNELLEEYNLNLYKRNEIVTFEKENTMFNAFVKKVNRNGELLINNGKDSTIQFGSVVWLTTK